MFLDIRRFDDNPIDQTLYQTMTLLPKSFATDFGGFHRTLQRVRLTNRGRLLLRTPGPVPCGTCICSNVETILSWTCHVYGPFESRTSLGTSILLGMRTADADSSGYLFPTHLGLAYVLLKTNPFPELVVIFFPDYTLHPSILSQFCLIRSYFNNFYNMLPFRMRNIFLSTDIYLSFNFMILSSRAYENMLLIEPLFISWSSQWFWSRDVSMQYYLKSIWNWIDVYVNFHIQTLTSKKSLMHWEWFSILCCSVSVLHVSLPEQ